MAGVANGNRPQPPAGWQPKGDRWDFDGDGTPDSLTFDREPNDSKPNRGTVTLQWAAGHITISGVRNANNDATITWDPAAVGDVTGDGLLDLIVTDGSSVKVIAGAGRASVTTDSSFDDLSPEPNGWVSPPTKGEPGSPPKPTGDEIDVQQIWDVNGDGVNDFVLMAPGFRRQSRSGLESYIYYGKPCQ